MGWYGPLSSIVLLNLVGMTPNCSPQADPIYSNTMPGPLVVFCSVGASVSQGHGRGHRVHVGAVSRDLERAEDQLVKEQKVPVDWTSWLGNYHELLRFQRQSFCWQMKREDLRLYQIPLRFDAGPQTVTTSSSMAKNANHCKPWNLQLSRCFSFLSVQSQSFSFNMF